MEQICHYIQDMFHYYVRTSGGRSFFSIEKVQHTGRGHSGGLHLSGQKFDAVGVTGNHYQKSARESYHRQTVEGVYKISETKK